jgi:hypothetical protein
MNWRLRALAASVLVGSIAAASPSAAQTSITMFAGYGGSDGIENATTGESADLKNAPMYGVALGMALDVSRELQLLLIQQSTTLSPGGTAAAFDLTIRYLHVGGTLYVNGMIGQGIYVVGGVGATQFSPGTGGYGSAVKPSMNLGVGYILPLGARIALTAEARGYLTLVNSSGGFLCSGGCVAVLSSDGVSQLVAKVGLVARF